MTERRFGDEEVREIFSLATTGDARDRSLPAESGGMTLAELQRIGEEAGIEPTRIAQAAMSLTARGTSSPVRRSFGMPIGLTRVIDLPRAPTDREWEQMISQFRTTYGTPGLSTSSGGLREWTQGDVHIAVEPTANGEQLRISALNTLAQVLNAFGMLVGGLAVIMGATVAAAGKPEKALVVLGMFGGMALIALGSNVVRLPSWARDRRRQLDATAEQAVKLLSGGA